MSPTDLAEDLAADLDADLGDRLAAGELGPVPDCLATFEARFMALVAASALDPELAWDRFYDATLARVAGGWGRGTAGVGTVATFTRIWSRAAGLAVGGSVLDVGTCFGFLPLAWSARPGAPRLLTADLSTASAALLGRQARRLGRPVTALCADGGALPLVDGAVDTVLLLHVLEHLAEPAGARLLTEALRVAARRVVVAVPVEPEPDPVFGHVRTFTGARLSALGASTGWQVSTGDSDGAWLVLDLPV